MSKWKIYVGQYEEKANILPAAKTIIADNIESYEELVKHFILLYYFNCIAPKAPGMFGEDIYGIDERGNIVRWFKDDLGGFNE